MTSCTHLEPASLLRTAVTTAQHRLLSDSRQDLASVNHVLADLLTDLAPVLDELRAISALDPDGAVAAVLGHLHVAFTHAAAGRPDAAITSMVTAAATAFRIADENALNDEADDPARWRA